MTHTEHTLTSNDGLDLYYQTWHPPEAPLATIIFQHGFCEHGGKYEHIAHHLVHKGYCVQALDLRGHGRSAGKRIYIDRFQQHVDDFTNFVNHVQKENCPTFILAHSMGGTIAILWAAQHQQAIQGLILCGAALHITARVPRILMLISDIISKLLPRLPTLQSRPPTPYTKDKNLQQKWAKDPLLYKGRIPARTGTEILKGAQTALEVLPQITHPTLILHGTADTLISPTGSQVCYDRISSQDKTLKYYDNLRHEILNEPERDLILQDIENWIQNKFFTNE